MEFVKKHWKWIVLAIIVIVAVAVYLKRRKSESGFDTPCMDCGPGGMFGPGWTMEKFTKQVDELRNRARELSGGISESEFEQAIKRSGGFIPYIQGREIAVKKDKEALDDLKDVVIQ